jgi:hypothetical protein
VQVVEVCRIRIIVGADQHEAKSAQPSRGTERAHESGRPSSGRHEIRERDPAGAREGDCSLADTHSADMGVGRMPSFAAVFKKPANSPPPGPKSSGELQAHCVTSGQPPSANGRYASSPGIVATTFM